MFAKAIVAKLAVGAMLAGSVVMISLPAQASPYSRVEHQQSRIARGVEDGQLTRGEYRRDEARLHAINQQRRFERQANGGHLAGAERARLNRELNHNSRHIWYTKHNYARQPGAPLR